MKGKKGKPKAKKSEPTTTGPIRLNRLLSLAGVTSRRKADQLIKEGRVRVNGKVVRQPWLKVRWGVDKVHVGDRELPTPRAPVYIMLNKPFGYICSLRDPEGRPLVTALLHNVRERVYPVGRLDFDTLGLLLLTNDGNLTHKLTHPRYKVPRTYKVTVAGTMPDAAIEQLRRGVKLQGGPVVRAKVKVLSRDAGQTILRMTISQGITRQIRRMLEASGFMVVHLIRTGYGPLVLGDLKVGEYRYLEREEVELLRKAIEEES